ncbi:MAG: type 1 glutamine amidotransferase [Acidobacteriota bacterium]|nr:type 1 glutamine amidotransferase [Acidobacteriota bacterium]
MSELRFLVFDAYPQSGRDALTAAGGTEAGTLYRRLLERLEPGAAVDVAFPADGPPATPNGVALEDYDGWVWTGSSLTIWHDDDPAVRTQIDLARHGYEVGMQQFGSCWAAQLAATAAGGEVGQNPRGREFGFAREIELNSAGQAHPMFEGKSHVFDGFTCHADIVTGLPESATLLASNEFTPIQALAVDHVSGSFWAIQYHPEYDLREIAALARLRREELIEQGSFGTRWEVRSWVEAAETLEDAEDREDLKDVLGARASVLEPGPRTLEVRNWIDHAVKPRRADR